MQPQQMLGLNPTPLGTSHLRPVVATGTEKWVIMIESGPARNTHSAETIFIGFWLL
jgi:hypothetical protein